ncbi:cytosine permease [Leucobacter rhizosphaerae]|uniref:Cytosine permease n=1 Tax=Leucobacter rhizosphaerae TaxID=2932245 RepID=A0ABY4FZ73_9MICO|nr:cytosine permease [Leucobacter rhizosphaerae]UOQ61570.1 cytosine permease [Leucobacter rhizosphaerae]
MNIALTDPATPVPPVGAPAALAVETHGINPIPLSERWARPRDVFGLVFGGANSISTAVLGTFPVVFGLTFWDGVIAILVGVVVGSLILAPMVLFGPRNGTNNAVSSSAHFGVHGRLVGSMLALLGAFTFLALAVWASGDALLASFARLFGFVPTDAMSAGVYTILVILLIVICVYGYRLLVVLNRYVPPLVGILFVVGIVAYASSSEFTTALAYAPEGRWSDPVYVGGFFGCVLIAMSCPISYGTFLGDYSRYVSDQTSKVRLMASVVWAQLACLVAFYFGHVTASVVSVASPERMASGDYVGGLLESAASWFFIPLALISVAGGLSTGTSLLYGTGLDFSSIVARLSRVASTLLIGVFTLVFVMVGKFVFDVVQAVTALSTILVNCTVPWIVIMLIGYFIRRGWYDVDALQVFNRRQTGGRYWYTHGWSIAAVLAWAVGVVAALLFVNLPGQFVGPLGNSVGGVDISLLVGLFLTAALYWVLLRIIPEPDYLFGPRGARGIPTRSGAAIPPIVPLSNTAEVSAR